MSGPLKLFIQVSEKLTILVYLNNFVLVKSESDQIHNNEPPQLFRNFWVFYKWFLQCLNEKIQKTPDQGLHFVCHI